MTIPVGVMQDSVPAPSPAPAPAPAAPAATPEPAPPAAPNGEQPAAPAAPAATYKLPDGREVDAEGLRAEYEKLLPEFTRRSQKLAQYEQINKPAVDPNLPAWQQEGWQPKTYQELIQVAQEAVLARIQAEQAQADAAKQAAVAQVDATLAELRKADPKLDENALFQHANKYGIRDLKVAHATMVEMANIAKATEERVANNFKARGGVPTGTLPGATPPATGTVDQAVLGKYGSALEYFRSLGQ